MNTKCQRFLSPLMIVGAVATLTAIGSTWAQNPAKPILGTAEITANDVYVRCGASLNHYPICKLSAGDRVSVVGEEGDWYEILAPDGTFSFISGEYVDTPDGKSGVVNGTKVRIRAGSNLPDFSQLKYAVQQQLSKGAEVTILGRDPDGFLRIKPPAGTTAWVSRAFVEFAPDGLSHANITEDGATPTTTEPDAGSPAVPGSPEAAATKFAGLPPTTYRKTLDEIDAATRAELTKPVGERRFDPLIERYQTIASQEEEDFARRYAQARVEQLTNMAALVGTVQRMGTLTAEVESKRNAFLVERGNIRETLPPIPTALDAQGELRVSALYPPGSVPARYRLVDTTGPVERTIGYVEIPPGSTITVDAYLGRYVGVRASAKRLQQGGVGAVPIFVAGDLTLLRSEK